VLTRAVPDLLYSVKPADALSYAVVVLILVLISVGACALPARRVTRIEALDAMRGAP
jgi:ABC-type lipoprotein release transport system permease subunit